MSTDNNYGYDISLKSNYDASYYTAADFIHSDKLINVVTIANSLDKSLKGTYYVGQTPTLTLNNSIVYGGLFNPPDSKVDAFVNVFTLTNFSDIPLNAEIWIGSTPPLPFTVSPLVTTTNTTISPPPISVVQLVYKLNSTAITNGVNAFDRVVPGKTTIVAEEDGKYIIAPNKFFIISLTPSAPGTIDAAIALGWFIRSTRC